MTLRPALLFLAVLVVATSSLPPSAEAGGDRSARRLRRSALAHYRDGDYADAARDFRAAYEIEAHAELLYALGQSLRAAAGVIQLPEPGALRAAMPVATWTAMATRWWAASRSRASMPSARRCFRARPTS